MEKPFLVCHMFASMDGKLRNFYDCTAAIYGTTTMKAFADGLAPENLPQAEAGFS